eukprot:TRINITY_DN14050_c0_g1_i1.p1 TRINITY_DN14050_c0_g1~~TRINITY_DN14050_c0_g1_i1.p1  ORF type:complete len:145 (-),score=28.98 TRINITY_DN14050_c0_g1_i1:19-453(-)
MLAAQETLAEKKHQLEQQCQHPSSPPPHHSTHPHRAAAPGAVAAPSEVAREQESRCAEMSRSIGASRQATDQLRAQAILLPAKQFWAMAFAIKASLQLENAPTHRVLIADLWREAQLKEVPASQWSKWLVQHLDQRASSSTTSH